MTIGEIQRACDESQMQALHGRYASRERGFARQAQLRRLSVLVGVLVAVAPVVWATIRAIR